MAESDKIKSSDIIQDDIFKNTIESGNDLVKVLQNIEKQFKENLKVQEQFLKTAGKKINSADDINKANSALKQSKETIEKLNKVEQERIKLQERLSNLNSKEVQDNLKLREQLKQETLVKRQLVQETTKELGAYKNLSARLNRLRKEYKDLAVSEGESSKKSRELLLEITKLDQKLKQVDQAAGQFQRNVGNYPSAFKNAGAALRSFIGAFGVTAGIAGFAQLLRNVVGTFSNFQQANVELAGVLGKTTEETVELTKQAKDLGATTSFTATEVLRLQEAYARLGFSQQEIIDLTPATIDGAVALRATADETAELVGAVVRSFDDFSTIDAPDIIDQLTLATQKSALNFSKLQTALPIVSGAANAAGIPFTKLVALLGKLSDAGIDASSSATALRNIFIDSAAQGKSYEEILDILKNSTDKLTGASDEFGKRTAVSASILSNQIDAIDELDKTLQNAGGTAEKVARQNLDTLQGSVKLLSSAWEGFILSIESGEGTLGRILRTTVDLTAAVLGFFTATNKTEEELRNANKSTLELFKSNTSLIDSSKQLSNRLDELSSKTSLTSEEKTELNNITNDLITTFGTSVGQINDETGALEINRAELIRQIQVRQALQQEQVKELLSEKLQLETQERNLKILEERFNFTKKQIREQPLDFIGISNLLELAENDAVGFSNALLQIQNSSVKLTDTQKQAIAVITQYSIANNQSSFNQERIKEIQDELLRSGIDLNELTKTGTFNVNKNTTATKDNTKAKKENYDATNDQLSLLNQFYTESEIKLIQSLTNQEITQDEFDKKSLELKRERINEEIKILDENFKDSSAKRKELAELELSEEKKTAKKINDALFALEEQRLKDEADAYAKRIDELKKYTQLATNIITDLQTQLNNSFEATNENLENDITKRQDNITKQRELASKGLTNTLQFEEKQLAEARNRQAENLRRQQKIEEAIQLTQAYFAAFNARVGDNPDQAPLLALKDVAIAKGIATGIQSLSSFFDGTENTGNGGKVDDRGGFYAVLHPQERVMTAKQNSKVGELSNNELADIAMMYNKGQLVNPFTDLAINVVNKDKQKDNSYLLIQGIAELKAEIKNKPVQMVNIDSLGNIVETVYRNGIKDTIKRKVSRL